MAKRVMDWIRVGSNWLVFSRLKTGGKEAYNQSKDIWWDNTTSSTRLYSGHFINKSQTRALEARSLLEVSKATVKVFWARARHKHANVLGGRINQWRFGSPIIVANAIGWLKLKTENLISLLSSSHMMFVLSLWLRADGTQFWSQTKHASRLQWKKNGRPNRRTNEYYW